MSLENLARINKLNPHAFERGRSRAAFGRGRTERGGNLIEPASLAECIKQARSLLETTTNWLQANRPDLLADKK